MLSNTKNISRNACPWIIIALLFLISTTSSLAQDFCDFDNSHFAHSQYNSDFLQEMMTDEIELQQAILLGLNEGSDLLKIPVVFHVLNLGEAVNTGSNISNAQILAALNDLNIEFSNALGEGFDVGIEFCLAQQDPDGHSYFDINGNNITGIQRVDASGISNFSTFGIWPSVNEVEAKALSNWPKDDYLNIWISHRIYTGDGEADGFAYFPAAGDEVDGITLRADATGIPSKSKVITHEAGHYLALHHTFRNGNNDCPINSNYDCSTNGDYICETRTHSQFNVVPYPCDESQYLSCDQSFNEPYSVTENHMNYTDNSCRDEFVPEQINRMRCVLTMLRGSLLYSVGCVQGCSDVTSSFTINSNIISVGDELDFSNTSIGGVSYNWLLDGETVSNSLDWSFTFDIGGRFEVCLDSYGDNDCINRYCKEIIVLPSCITESNPCEKVQNGDFEEIAPSDETTDYNNVCGWRVTQSTPFYCDYLNNNLAVILLSNVTDFVIIERITSEHILNLGVGDECTISFDYVVASSSEFFFDSPEKITVALASSNQMSSSSTNVLESDATIIAEVYHPPVDYFNMKNHKCVDDSYTLRHFQATPFTVDNVNNQYLTITGIGSTEEEAYVLIDNISIVCCETSTCNPLPDFVYDEECPKQFLGMNDGDGDEYSWNFLCNEVTMSGQNVTIDLPAGDCEICLTASCDAETSATICKTVTIPEEFSECEPVCEDLTVYLETCKQDLLEENTFIADFSISVPDGTTACDGVDIVSGSNQFDASASVSIEDDPNDPTLDIVNVSITFITPPGTDILNNSIAGLINLCDPDGNVICYNLTCVATECTNCLGDITAAASCIDPNPFDDVQIYEGSVTIDLPPGSYQECNPISTEIGYSQTVIFSGSAIQPIATLDFTINTLNEENFNATSLLCFYDQAQMVEYCFTLNIDIDPCPPPPDCIDWDPKITDATNCTVIDDQVTYNVNMSDVWLFGSGYSDCGSGLEAYLDGSDQVVLNGGSITNNGSDLSYSTTITMPCGFDTDQIYELIIVACDADGRLVCFSFNIRFPDCDENCDDRGGNETRERSASPEVYRSLLEMYPNPTREETYISVKNPTLKQHNIIIYDQLGSTIVKAAFSGEVRLDLSDLQAGLHFVRVTDDEGNLIGIEKLIILK